MTFAFALCLRVSSAAGGGSQGAVTSLAYSPDGKRLAVGAYGQAVVFDTADWHVAGTFLSVEDAVRALAWHPEGKLLAIGSGRPSESGKVAVWDTSGGAPPVSCTGQDDTIESLAFRADGKELLVGADDNKVRLFAAFPAQTSAVLDEHNGRVQAVAFAPKADTYYATGALDKIVKVWDAKSNKSVVNFDTATAGITGLTFLPNGQIVGASLDGRLYWWGVSYDQKKNTYGGYRIRQQDAHTDGVNALALSGDGARLITGGEDKKVVVWNSGGGKLKEFTDSPEPIYAVALSRDGKQAAAAGRDGIVRIYDVETDKPITTLTLPPLPSAKPTTAATKPAQTTKRK